MKFCLSFMANATSLTRTGTVLNAQTLAERESQILTEIDITLFMPMVETSHLTIALLNVLKDIELLVLNALNVLKVSIMMKSIINVVLVTNTTPIVPQKHVYNAMNQLALNLILDVLMDLQKRTMYVQSV